MWTLDTRTVLVMNLVLAVVMAVILHAQQRSLPKSVHGFNEWMIATLGGAVTSAVLVFREVPYSLYSVATTNTLLLGMAAYYFAGTCRFVGMASPHRHLPWLLLLSYAAFVVVFHASPFQLWSAALSTLSIGAVTVLHLRVLQRASVTGVGGGCLRVALWCSLFAVAWRIYQPLVHEDMVWAEPPISMPTRSALPSVLYTLSFVLTSMAFVMLGLDRVHQMLEQLAARDPLTNAFNRRAFIEAANRELERSRRYGTHLAVLQMDLDYFKRINDTYGHQAGDRVLVDFSRRVAGLLRSSDIFGRFGGEEFVILLAQTTPEEAYVVAERIRSLTAEATGEPRYTVSIGGVSRCGGSPALEELIAEADAALYRAKHGGRNRVEFIHSPAAAAGAATETPAAAG